MHHKKKPNLPSDGGYNYYADPTRMANSNENISVISS